MHGIKYTETKTKLLVVKDEFNLDKVEDILTTEDSARQRKKKLSPRDVELLNHNKATRCKPMNMPNNSGFNQTRSRGRCKSRVNNPAQQFRRGL